MIHNEIQQHLVTLFSHPDADQRRQAAEQLASSRSAVVSSSLTLALQDADKGVRDSAARALLEMRSKSAGFAIAEYLVDSSFVTRNLASNLLLQFGSDAVEPLLRYAVHENHDVRKLAIDTLGLIGDPTANPVLTTLVNDPDDNVVLAVVEAFGNIKDASVVPHLAMIYATYPYSRTVVVEAIGKIGSSDAAPFLMAQLEAMGTPDGEDQLVAFAIVEALAGTGTPHVLEKLVPYCRTSSGKMRNIALFAVVCIAERYEIPLSEYQNLAELFKAAVKDDDTRIVIASVKALLTMMDEEVEAVLLHLIGRNGQLDQLILNNLQGGGRSFLALCRKYPSFQRDQKKTVIEFIMPQLNELAASDDDDIRSARAEFFAQLVGEWTDADDDLRPLIIDALFYLDDERAVAYFSDLVSDTYFWLRMRVLELVAEISHYRGVDVLARFVNDPDETLRSFVQSVLLSRGLLAEASTQEGVQ